MNKLLTWAVTLPDGHKIGGARRLTIKQDYENLPMYLDEVKQEILANIATQQQKDN